ncbi:MAG: ABC-type Fe3+ transport system, permease component [Bacilli bacterium]|nr:ABC-type Fe3+ transport system, permease component [Bacilli bacterium]
MLLGLVVYPLGSILLQSLFPKLFEAGFGQFSLQSYSNIFKVNYTYKAILDALLFGGGSAVITSIIGTLLAIVVHRKWSYGSRWVTLMVWLVFFTPSYLIAEGWVLLMQHNGILTKFLMLPNGTLDWFFTPGGLIMAMSLRLFPVVYLSVLAGLGGLGSDFEEAARTAGAGSLVTWVRINIPLLAPSILAGATLTFAEAVSDFGFASAIVPKAHIPLLTYSIFTALNQMPVNYPQVGALSVVLIGIIAVSLWIQKWILGRGSYSIIQNQIRPHRVRSGPGIGWTLTVNILLIAAYLLPMIGVVVTSLLKQSGTDITWANLTFAHYAKALKIGGQSFQALQRSFGLAVGTASVSTALGIGLAFVITRVRGFSTNLLYVLTMSTIAIPGIVLAAGFVFAWNAPYLVPWHLNLYGTLFCVYLAYLAGSLPHSIRLQMAALGQISPSLLSAGQVHGANLFVVFRKIILPLVAATTISTFYLTFSHAMFEMPASELLYPPDQPPMPVVIVKFYNNLQNENGAALTVLTILVVAACYGFGQLLLYGLRQIRHSLAIKGISKLVQVDPNSTTSPLIGQAQMD